MIKDQSSGRTLDARLPPDKPATFPWWLLYVCFVVYGSLVPLDFHAVPWTQALETFRHIKLLDIGAQGRADWISNGVLYVPVGFLTVTLFVRYKAHHTLPFAFAGSLLFSFTLAVAVEFAQLFFPPRTVSVNDIVAEFVGSIFGAVLAARWSDWFISLLSTLVGKPDRLLANLAKAYAIGYAAFSLFPYDFLLSASELAWKFHSDSWGWLIAPESMGGSITHALAKLFAETLIAVPLGLMLCQLTSRRTACSPARAFFAGALLGLAIETIQFFIVSGISQGLSLLTRAAGMSLGALLWRHRARLGPQRLMSEFRRFVLPASLLYLIALTAVSGWFEHRWLSIGFAMKALDEVHFLPFYYHYYTTEQAALLSLTSICLLYAPIGILTWASANPPGMAMFAAPLTAGCIETSKLFLEGLHPDPTNLLIAGFSAWATATLSRRLASAPATSGERQLSDNTQMADAASRRMRSLSENSPTADSNTTGSSAPLTGFKKLSWVDYAMLIASFACVSWGVATFPFQPALLGLLLTAYAALIWHRPARLLVAIPAALALLDLAHWSGRFYFDEFDFLLLTSIAIGYARLPPASRHSKYDPLFLSLTLLLGLSYAIGAIRGLQPWQMPDANAFSNYYSPYNAMRIAKGALWALLLYGLLRRLASAGQNVRGLFAHGMIAGLAGTTAILLWERFVFPGLFNFIDVYRVTGPFSQMHTGGADIETYLTLSAPFLVVLFFESRSLAARLAAIILLVGATYGMMVTFSRIGYAAYCIAIGLALLAAMAKSGERAPSKNLKRGIGALALAALVLATAVPILKSPFAQERMSQSGSDLTIRVNHWADALQMRDPGWPTALFGMGIGRYPETHYWRSTESRAATYRVGSENGNAFLRLGSGAPLYIEQFATIRPHKNYTLDLSARSTQPNAQVNVSICEKWLLTSERCTFKSIDIAGSGQWQTITTHLQSGEIGSGPWYATRPAKLSIYNSNANTVLDVDNVSLHETNGGNRLVNGNFSAGMDRWFFTIDNDKPWHIWSLPVQVLFDQGWLGVAALTLFIATGLWRAGRNAWCGDVISGAMLASASGFVVIGALDSLLDSPRLILMFLLLIWFCAQTGNDRQPNPE